MNERDLVLHIGFRKTGTSYIQGLFSEIGLHDYYGAYSKRSKFTRSIISSYPDQWFDEAYLRRILLSIRNQPEIERREDSGPILVSAEGFSIRPSGRTIMDDAFTLQKRAYLVSEFPFIRLLPRIKKIWRVETGGEVKVLVGTRRRATILASEYAQQSAFYIKASQFDFEKRVRAIISSDDEGLIWSTWLRVIRDIVGSDNLIWYSQEDLSSSFNCRLVGRLGYDESIMGLAAAYEDKFDRSNQRSVAEYQWAIRNFDIALALSLRQSLKGRILSIRNSYRLKILNSILENMLNREDFIFLSGDIIETIEERYAEDHAIWLSDFERCRIN